MYNRIIPWIRMLYFANLTVVLVVAVMYLFGITIPPINGISLPDPILILIGYVLAFLLWLLLDRIQVIDNTPWLANTYDNRGLRGLDIGLIVFGLLMLVLAWRSGFAGIAVLVTGTLLVISGILGLFQLPRPTQGAIVDALVPLEEEPTAEVEAPPGI